MADIRLSSKKGMVFNSQVINNTNDLYLIDVKMNASPSMRFFEFDVPKRHGSNYYDNKYEDQVIKVTIGIKGSNIVARKTKQREVLSKLLNKDGMLSFLDEPNLFYYAKAFDAVRAKDDRLFTMLDIEFIASYCKYEFIGDLNDYISDELNIITEELDIVTNSLEWTNINISTYKSITNAGNFEAMPVIKVTANTACESVTIDNGINSFTLTNLTIGDIIFVDTEKMIVYKIVDNAKVSVMDRFVGEFISVPAGENMITIYGSNFDINLEVNYRNTYIV